MIISVRNIHFLAVKQCFYFILFYFFPSETWDYGVGVGVLGGGGGGMSGGGLGGVCGVARHTLYV